MKQNLLKFFLLTVEMLVAFSPQASAYDFIVDGIAYNINTYASVNSVSVTYENSPEKGYSNLTGNITIPSSVSYNGTNYTVSDIGSHAFYNCTQLASITIPNSVSNIWSGAFYGCRSLKSINIPNSVLSISMDAFSGCSGLTSVSLGSVRGISQDAFYGCTGLSSIIIPSTVYSIGSNAFGGCANLKNVTLNSKDIVSAQYSAENNLSSRFGTQVKKYIIGENNDVIGDYAFYGCAE